MFFSARVKQSGGEWEQLPSAHHPLRSARFLQFSTGVKVAAQVVKENRVTKFGILQVLLRDVWRHLGFSEKLKTI